MAFARLLNNLCDQLHETTGLLWGWAQGEGEATEAILRPLCFLDDSGYRFGISVAKIEGQLFVGIRIVHNRKIATNFGRNLSRPEFQLARQQLAGFFKRHSRHEWTIWPSDDSESIRISCEASNFPCDWHFSGLPFELEVAEASRSLTSSEKHRFADSNIWKRLQATYPANVYSTGNNPKRKAPIAGSHFFVAEPVSPRGLNARYILTHWMHLLGCMPITMPVRGGEKVHIGWRSNKSLWNEIKHYYASAKPLCANKECPHPKSNSIELDHVVPKGAIEAFNRRFEVYNSPANILLLCKECHKAKGKFVRPRLLQRGPRWYVGAMEIAISRVKHRAVLSILPHPNQFRF